MNRPGTAEVRWPRIYRVFRAVGHDPAPATEIVLDAKRKDDHARAWIKAVLAMSAAISILESWLEGGRRLFLDCAGAGVPVVVDRSPCSGASSFTFAHASRTRRLPRRWTLRAATPRRR
jgi:hypothetical protein